MMKSAAAFAFVLLAFARCAYGPDEGAARPQSEDADGVILGISLDRDALALELHKNVTLAVSFNPPDAPNRDIIWTSSNEDIVMVNKGGSVTGIGWGRSTITATTAAGGKSARCVVYVGLSLDAAGKSAEALSAAINAACANAKGYDAGGDGSTPEKAFAVKARGVDCENAEALNTLYRGLAKAGPDGRPARYVYLDLSGASGARVAAARPFTFAAGRRLTDLPLNDDGEGVDVFEKTDDIDTAGIVSLILPDAVTEIENGLMTREGEETDDLAAACGFTGAFAGFRGLKRVSAPGLRRIGALAFADCAGLETALFPHVTELGAYAFCGDASLIGSEMGGLEEMGRGAFYGCAVLRTARFLSLRRIGAEAFARCPALETLSVPQAEFLGRAAFAAGSGKITLTAELGAKAPELGERLFDEVTAFKNVAVKPPRGADGYSEIPEDDTYPYADCWANAFRGRGWSPESGYGEGAVNGRIKLSFHYR